MKLTLKTAAKPRNPFVMAASRRNAGSHRKGAGALRQQARRSLRLEIERAKPSP